MKSKILIAILATLFLTNCSKYEEGPRITFTNWHKNILGEWHLKSYINKGIDSTAYKLNNEYFFHTLYFGWKDNNIAESYMENDIGKYYNIFDWDCVMALHEGMYFYFKLDENSNSQNDQKITSNIYPVFEITKPYTQSTWGIIKLTKHNLKIQYNYYENGLYSNLFIEYEK